MLVLTVENRISKHSKDAFFLTSLPLGGRLFVSPIITQIGRENKSSADIYMCIRRGDLRSPAGEHSSPLPCSENILMRTRLMLALTMTVCIITIEFAKKQIIISLFRRDVRYRSGGRPIFQYLKRG